MNDRHLDPPETPEPPYCCGDYMEVLEDGSCKCEKCGKAINPPEDVEPPYCHDPLPEEEGYPQDVKCPHGRPLGDCDHCDYMADIKFDEMRERRLFR